MLYFQAVMNLITGGLFSPIGFALIAGSGVAANATANNKRYGWILGVAISSIPVLFMVADIAMNGLGVVFNFSFLINSVFPIAQLVALVHPHSRDYGRIMFD